MALGQTTRTRLRQEDVLWVLCVLRVLCVLWVLRVCACVCVCECDTVCCGCCGCCGCCVCCGRCGRCGCCARVHVVRVRVCVCLRVCVPATGLPGTAELGKAVASVKTADSDPDASPRVEAEAGDAGNDNVVDGSLASGCDMMQP